MDDDLIDAGGLSLERKSRLPGTGFFYPDSLDEEYAERRTREAVAGSEAVVVADTDADGLGCVALVRAARNAAVDAADFEASMAARLSDGEGRAVSGSNADGDGDTDATDLDAAAEAEADARPESTVALVGAGPYSLGDALGRVADHLEPGADVYVCDLCPDAYDDVAAPLERLPDRAGTVRWFDHHRWEPEIARRVRAAGVDLVVGDSDEECSTDVALRSLDAEFPAHLHDLAAVTRDHDLWVRADERSDDLADYAHWADPEEYVAVVGSHGPDLPPDAAAYVAERRVEKERLVEFAAERARTHEIGPWTVASTYGRCSQNEVAERLREAGADAAVIVKPAGSASIRGSEGFERAHEVAALVGGGGHPKAAGCKPDVHDDMLDYAAHWTSGGETTRRVILAAFERVAARVAGDEAAGD
jgi:oligoribonuclease NrnB/cAMP/cGMP phosphodiesterase (DHH superfamily)